MRCCCGAKAPCVKGCGDASELGATAVCPTSVWVSSLRGSDHRSRRLRRRLASQCDCPAPVQHAARWVSVGVAPKKSTRERNAPAQSKGIHGIEHPKGIEHPETRFRKELQ